jgi:hypothetical protein
MAFRASITLIALPVILSGLTAPAGAAPLSRAEIDSAIAAEGVQWPETVEDVEAKEESESTTPWKGKNAFEVWEEEHRWFRLGFRGYGYLPAVDDAAALGLGAGFTVPFSTDFFMGLGMKISFTASWNQGKGDGECIDRGGASSRFEIDCPDGHKAGVDLTWKQPVIEGDPNAEDPGRSQEAIAGSSFVEPQRRPAHVAMFALTIGGGYEVTIPNIEFFRIFQPFIGGGVVVGWVYVWPDLSIDENAILDLNENNLGDSDNIDPWSSQGPEVGGEVYGGFHINPDDAFRMVFEVAYLNLLVEEAFLTKTREDFQAKHQPFTLSQFRFGWGIEFKF